MRLGHQKIARSSRSDRSITETSKLAMFLLLQVRVQRYFETHSVGTVIIAAIVGPDVELSLICAVGKRTLGSTTDVGFAC